MSNRISYHVTYRKDSKRWYVIHAWYGEAPIREDGPTPIISVNTSKLAAIWTARKMARNLWKNGELSQVVIHGKNGRIQLEWTYGKDPRNVKG